MEAITYSAAAGLLFVAATRFSPLLACQRAVTWLRAVGMVLPIAARAAVKEIRREFGYCLLAVRREE